MADKLTQARAYEVLHLDVETGVLTWRVQTGSRAVVGARAGTLHGASGYRFVKVDGWVYREHILIWFMLYGEWRPREVDHKNLDRADNRPVNLRLATESQQHANMKIRSDNTTGERGVSVHKATGKYVAEVWNRGEKRYLGLFSTPQEASAVARKERLRVFGPFAPSYDHAGDF